MVGAATRPGAGTDEFEPPGPSVRAARPRRYGSYEKARRRLIVPFLAPAAVLMIVFILYPVAKTVQLSLTDWNGVTRALPYVGARNYGALATDAAFISAFKNTILLTVIGGAILFPVAVAFAWALCQPIKGKRFFQFTIFAPVVLSVAVAGLLWKFVYHPTLGLINPALETVGLDGLARTWLGDPSTALTAVAVTVVWQSLGLWVILLVAGFTRLPADVLEAARVDGASEWTVWRRVMLPLLGDLLRILLAMWIINALQTFGFVWIMTEGGPFGSTEVVGTLMVKAAFDGKEFGYAAAMGIVLIVFMIAVVAVLNRYLRRRDFIEY